LKQFVVKAATVSFDILTADVQWYLSIGGRQ